MWRTLIINKVCPCFVALSSFYQSSIANVYKSQQRWNHWLSCWVFYDIWRNFKCDFILVFKGKSGLWNTYWIGSSATEFLLIPTEYLLNHLLLESNIVRTARYFQPASQQRKYTQKAMGKLIFSIEKVLMKSYETGYGLSDAIKRWNSRMLS